MSKGVGLSGGARRSVVVLIVVVWVVLWTQAASGGLLAPLAGNAPVSDAGDSRTDAAAIAACDVVDDHALPLMFHIATPDPLVFTLCCGRLLQAGRSLPPAVRPPVSVA